MSHSAAPVSNLNARAWRALAFLAAAMAVLLFAAAGTVRYWQAWLYLTVFFGGAVLITMDLMRRDPALLERRLRGGPTAEKRPIQKFIMFWMQLGFIAVVVVPALDRRYGWSAPPIGAVLGGNILVAIGCYVTFLVYKENTFTSAIIDVAADQRVVSSGPYAVVRHPMYAGMLLYVAGTPLALGSYWGFIGVAATLPFLLWRLFDEERFLREQLPDYADYQQKVRRRLVPGIW